MTRGRAIVLSVTVGVVALGAFAAYRLLRAQTLAPAAGPVVPRARVTLGSLQLTVHMQGDLRATKSVALSAPAVGGTLRILSLVDTGTIVTKDSPIMDFDPADQQFALEQAESELLEAEQELIKRRAEIKAQEAQDKVTLLTAQFDVRRAELDARVDADLISANEHKIRLAELQEAKRNLARVQQEVQSRIVTSKTGLTVLSERKMRSEMAAARARQNMENLVIKAPMDGVVSIRENFDAMMMGGFFDGMSVPPFRAGDNTFSGRPVIDVFDMATMEIRARVNEQERANVSPGQTARIESDAVPGASITATVSAVSGLGRPDNRMGPLRQFDVTLELKNPDPRLRPGTSVRVLVQGTVVEKVLLLPRQALFEVDGKPTVYVRTTGADLFAGRQIKVVHRTESQIAIEGLEEGTEVALVDPATALRLSGAAAASGKSPGGKQ